MLSAKTEKPYNLVHSYREEQKLDISQSVVATNLQMGPQAQVLPKSVRFLRCENTFWSKWSNCSQMVTKAIKHKRRRRGGREGCSPS